MAARTITVVITDPALAADLDTALCGRGGYQPTIPDQAHPGQRVPNPVTPAGFASQQLARMLASIVQDYRRQQAQAAITVDATGITVQ